MTWSVNVAKDAQKLLAKIPAKDEEHIIVALQQMRSDPFSGDIVKLKNARTAWRRRVGNFRIFFDVYHEQLLVDVVGIERRTSKTY